MSHDAVWERTFDVLTGACQKLHAAVSEASEHVSDRIDSSLSGQEVNQYAPLGIPENFP
jgi:hypothetical protein